MKVYLVQHAEAKRSDEDPERPLTKKGLKDIKRVAKYAQEYLHIKVNNIIHSGKLRAKQTAEILADHLHPAEGVGHAEGLEPLDDVEIWRKRLSEATEDTMVVGHLPHLSRLTYQLLHGDVAFRNGGIVCLEKDEEGHWSLQWMITPRILP